MSMLVRTGTMVRSKRSRSPRQAVTQSRRYTNQALTPEDARDCLKDSWPDRTSVLSVSSSSQLLQPSDEYDDPDAGTYGSIFSQLHDATVESDGTCEFLQRTIYIIYTSLAMTMILTLLLVLPISMVSVGASHLSECPVEPNIPLYLLIGGCLGFIKILLVIWDQQQVRRNGKLGELDESEEDSDRVMVSCARFTSQMLSMFHFVWFVLANYWLFSIWKPNFEQPLYYPNNWCNKTVYFFTFYQILTIYGILSLIVVFILCIILCHACHMCCRRDYRSQLL